MHFTQIAIVFTNSVRLSLCPFVRPTSVLCLIECIISSRFFDFLLGTSFYSVNQKTGHLILAHNFGKWEWLTHENKSPLHMCYHVKFGSAASKGVRINRRDHPNWGALEPRPFGVGAWMSP